MIKFGTGGWRAVIGSDFIEKNICLVAEGICALMKEEGKTDKPVMVGYDHRFLSEEAATWLAEVLAAHGVTVWFMNRSAPTPMVMHTVKRQNLYYGVEITASHNPASYNGIKLIVEEGRDAPLETTARLEELIGKFKLAVNALSHSDLQRSLHNTVEIEEEISDLDEADKKEFLADLGVESSGLDRLIAASYKLLGLISYLTAGPQEARAWTITQGTKAPQAAGKIHSDFERGFIRAEIVAYEDLDRLGTYNAAKEQGLVRSEGKEYVMKDGDVVLFRFNV